MHKTLYLMRHAKAEQTPGLRDFDRGLMDRGMRDSRKQARELFHQTLPDKFVVSAAVRTMQTVQYMQEELRFDEARIQVEERLYLASVREMLEVICQLDDLWANVCVVGHNPSVSYLAEYLTGHEIGDMKTAGIVKMNFDGRWTDLSQGSAFFEFYQEPQ